MTFGPIRVLRLERRKTRWWGRRRWDCRVVNESRWMGWQYRERERAVAHAADLVRFEMMLEMLQAGEEKQ
jgi:hypothetical protein